MSAEKQISLGLTCFQFAFALLLPSSHIRLGLCGSGGLRPQIEQMKQRISFSQPYSEADRAFRAKNYRQLSTICVRLFNNYQRLNTPMSLNLWALQLYQVSQLSHDIFCSVSIFSEQDNKIKARIAPCLDFWISRTNVGYFTSMP